MRREEDPSNSKILIHKTIEEWGYGYTFTYFHILSHTLLHVASVIFARDNGNVLIVTFNNRCDRSYGLIMGNAGSNQPVGHHHGGGSSREHRHTKDHPPPSPGKEGQAFVFDKKPIIQKLVFQSSEEEPYYAKV